MAATTTRPILRTRPEARSPFAFVLWLAAYVIFVILPLPLGLINLDPGRGF